MTSLAICHYILSSTLSSFVFSMSEWGRNWGCSRIL